MLIRSQDKKRIINLDTIATINIVDNYRDAVEKIPNAIVTCGYSIGNYSTEEKAIKVLDMIQLCYLESNVCADCQTYGVAGVLNIVFQMPQDSEVE